MQVSPKEALTNLGMNDLEAEVYLFLLPSEPLTAYRIGQSIGRATANVYKAVESLARRGAVVVADGEQRTVRAVPPDDLARQLERDFRASLDRAKSALSELPSPPIDERVYRVESAARVFERATEMLRGARRYAVVDAFPAALERVRPALEAAVRRGAEVFVEAYAPFDLAGAHVAIFPDGARSVEAWGSEQLNVVTDGKELVVALLTKDLAEVRQAIWTNSLYLACLEHAGRLSEHTLVAATAALAEGRRDDALRILGEHPFFLRGDVPGQQMLAERLTPRAPPKGRRPNKRSA